MEIELEASVEIAVAASLISGLLFVFAFKTVKPNEVRSLNFFTDTISLDLKHDLQLSNYLIINETMSLNETMT